MARSAQVSVGWVSSVRKHLLEQEWAAEDPTGFKVTRPHAILDSWVKQPNTWPKNAEIRDYSVLLNDPEELAAKLKEALPGQEAVFTQWFAAWLRHPYTETPIVTAYVKSFPEDALIKEKLLGRRVSDGKGRLRLVLPKDQGALNPTQTVRGFQLVSDVQIYLDLLGAGLRGDEQAAELRKWSDFAGGGWS
ncbi:MAG: hypothetical protein AB9869_01000 [Verrucomicrobiia bacterium]